jgi:hypothetical protein
MSGPPAPSRADRWARRAALGAMLSMAAALVGLGLVLWGR